MKGKYNYKQLVNWRDTLTQEIEKNKLLSDLWVSMAASDSMNKVSIGFEEINGSVLEERLKWC